MFIAAMYLFFVNTVLADAKIVGMKLLLSDKQKMRGCIVEGHALIIEKIDERMLYSVTPVLNGDHELKNILITRTDLNTGCSETTSDIKVAEILGIGNTPNERKGFEKIDMAAGDGEGGKCCKTYDGWKACGYAVEICGKTCCVRPCCGALKWERKNRGERR